MKDKILESMKKKDCILGIVPDNGGMWLSPLRPDTPRNFAYNPMTFTDSHTAQSEVATGNFTLSVNFSQTGNQTGSINIGCLRVNYNESGKYTIILYITYHGMSSQYAPFGSDGFENLAKVQVSKTSSKNISISLYDSNGELIDSTNGLLLDSEEISTGSAATNFPGNITEAFIRDDATSETVWQASRDELYETNPWPSATARNFAEEPMTWTDAMTAANQIGSDDWSFQIKMNVLSQIQHDSGEIFNNESGSPLKLYGDLIASGSAAFYLRNYVELETWTGKHELQLDVVSGNATLYVDGTLVATKPTGLSTLNFTRASKTSADIEIEFVEFRNLTTGKTVWSHPSEAERVRLLTKNNVRTDRGVFEAADASKRWSVTTQLRAASLLPECTIIVEADNPGGDITTMISCAQRLNPTQGFFVIRRSDSTSVMFGYSGKNSSGVTSYPTRFITCQGGKHVFAFVLDYSALQLRIYIDGAEVDNRAMDTGLVAPPELDGTEKPVILGATSTSDGLNLTSKISHCLIFDRALTASEIAALS